MFLRCHILHPCSKVHSSYSEQEGKEGRLDLAIEVINNLKESMSNIYIDIDIDIDR